MKIQEIKLNNSNFKYSILIGENILGILAKRIKALCPNARKIALVVDNKVPSKFKKILKNELKNYNHTFLSFSANEKSKSLKTVNFFLEKLLSKNFNRTDLIIGVGGGITGDVAGFIASIFKRGLNFINIPTTLLAQVDSAIGGKTGVNSKFGKNLVGSFYQPNLVVSDTSFLKSLPKREMICGYAEILKHSIIKDKKFFNWLKKNSKFLLSKEKNKLIYAIKKSCLIKKYFVDKDVNEKSLRMTLNFGHTFAHAIEAKNKYSNITTHGEAVLSGIILATRLSLLRKVCKKNVLKEIENIYNQNKLSYTYNKFTNPKLINSLIPFLRNDKKNNDQNINFILIKDIGKITLPNKNKISLDQLKKYSRVIARY